MAKKVKVKYVPIARDLWIELLNMDSNKNTIHPTLKCKFVSDEQIPSKQYSMLRRLTISDMKTNELFCVKYVLFKDQNGKLDIDVNNPYYCILYKI